MRSWISRWHAPQTSLEENTPLTKDGASWPPHVSSLALQIEGDAKGLTRHMDERTVCVVGGMDFQKQLDKLDYFEDMLTSDVDEL